MSSYLLSTITFHFKPSDELPQKLNISRMRPELSHEWVNAVKSCLVLTVNMHSALCKHGVSLVVVEIYRLSGQQITEKIGEYLQWDYKAQSRRLNAWKVNSASLKYFYWKLSIYKEFTGWFDSLPYTMDRISCLCVVPCCTQVHNNDTLYSQQHQTQVWH